MPQTQVTQQSKQNHKARAVRNLCLESINALSNTSKMVYLSKIMPQTHNNPNNIIGKK